MGAGRPTVIPMKNGLARGVRQASDFLMALQLTGAAKTESIANLQVRMPVVVIGGGLTAIDTATESLAYYVVQVEKFLDALRDARRGARRAGSSRQLDAGRARDAAWSSLRTAAQSAPNVLQPPRDGRPVEPDSAAELLGRVHRRLSPPSDRFAKLHAQSRRSR